MAGKFIVDALFLRWQQFISIRTFRLNSWKSFIKGQTMFEQLFKKALAHCEISGKTKVHPHWHGKALMAFLKGL